MTDNRTTELLREGLTEHGIEWRSGLKGVTFVGDWCFVEYENGKLAATCEPVLTPEQAIAATLGSGTCENVFPGRPIDRHMMFQCSACGHVKTNGTYPPEWWDAEHTDDECAAYDGEPIRFCPHCGAEVVGAC